MCNSATDSHIASETRVLTHTGVNTSVVKKVWAMQQSTLNLERLNLLSAQELFDSLPFDIPSHSASFTC